MPDVAIHGPDGTFSAYLAEPDRSQAPGILVMQEIFGVNQDLRAHCDALAAQGYLALCPDLFWRQEPNIQLTDQSKEEWARAVKLYRAFDVDKGIEDSRLALGHLRSLPRCNARVGTIGFCLGGLLAYLMGTRSDADCNVSYYGVGIDAKLDEATSLKRPTILHLAEEDEYVSKDAQQAIRTGLADHKSITIYSYAGMKHAFARHGGIHYDAPSARIANQRSAEFFRAHLM